MQFIKLKVLDIGEHTGRKVVKVPTYFTIHCEFFEQERYFNLSNDAVVLYFYIVSRVYRNGSKIKISEDKKTGKDITGVDGRINLNARMAIISVGLENLNHLTDCIIEMLNSGLLEIHDNVFYDAHRKRLRCTLTEQNRTEPQTPPLKGVGLLNLKEENLTEAKKEKTGEPTNLDEPIIWDNLSHQEEMSEEERGAIFSDMFKSIDDAEVKDLHI